MKTTLKLFMLCSICISCADEQKVDFKQLKKYNDSVYNYQLDSTEQQSINYADSVIKWSDSTTMYKIYKEGK